MYVCLRIRVQKGWVYVRLMQVMIHGSGETYVVEDVPGYLYIYTQLSVVIPFREPRGRALTN